jgi:hypothetical protein
MRRATPGDFAKVYDRTARDENRAQTYGENFECSPERPTLHPSPIEDEGNVDGRRASMGLIRLAIWERILVAISPEYCGPGLSK